MGFVYLTFSRHSQAGGNLDELSAAYLNTIERNVKPCLVSALRYPPDSYLDELGVTILASKTPQQNYTGQSYFGR